MLVALTIDRRKTDDRYKVMENITCLLDLARSDELNKIQPINCLPLAKNICCLPLQVINVIKIMLNMV